MSTGDPPHARQLLNPPFHTDAVGRICQIRRLQTTFHLLEHLPAELSYTTLRNSTSATKMTPMGRIRCWRTISTDAAVDLAHTSHILDT
jgi:hypothetical protein